MRAGMKRIPNSLENHRVCFSVHRSKENAMALQLRHLTIPTNGFPSELGTGLICYALASLYTAPRLH